MARTPFRVEVLTPEGSVFDDEVEMVSTRTEVGSIGILARHQPLLGMLVPTELRLYPARPTSCATRRARATSRSPTTACSCSSRRPTSPGELDAADLREKLREAEDALSGGRGRTPRSSARGARDKRRWEAFLRDRRGRP